MDKVYKLVETYAPNFPAFVTAPAFYIGTEDEVEEFKNEKNNSIVNISDINLVKEVPVEYRKDIKFTFNNVWGFPYRFTLSNVKIKVMYFKNEKYEFQAVKFSGIDFFKIDHRVFNHNHLFILGNQNFKIVDEKIDTILMYCLPFQGKIGERLSKKKNPNTYPFVWDIIRDG